MRMRGAALAVATVALMLLLAPSDASANTVLSTAGCSTSTARSIDSPIAGGASRSSDDCTIGFGSTDGTAMLHVFQADSSGSALTLGSTGALDTSFDGDGLLVDNHSASMDEYRNVVIQPDGKLVVIGVHGTGTDMYIRRYLPSGALDTTFAVAGERFLAGTYDVRDLALAADGSIFALGYGGDKVQVVKLTPSGDLDPTWNGGTYSNRYFTAAFDNGIAAESLTIGRGGEVYVGGYSSMPGEQDFVVINLTADGRYDPTFDSDGVKFIDIAGADAGRGIVEQPDGRIVLAGAAQFGTQDVAIVRLMPDGTYDTSFSGDGIATTNIGTGSDYARAVDLRPDGSIVVAGWYRAPDASYDGFVAQFTPAGVLDTSFSGDGIAPLALGTGDEWFYDMQLDPQGRAVLVGLRDQADDQLIIARQLADGTMDASFGTGGAKTYEGGDTGEELRGVTVGPDGRIAAAGMTTSGTDGSALLFVLRRDTVSDYATGSSDFTTGTNAFGACLRGVGGSAQTGATTWTVNSGCPLTTGAWWRGVPTSMGAASKVANTTTAGAVDATASLRFGVKLAGSEPPGSYRAPIVVDVIAPNLDPPANTASPTISGTTQVKQLLTATTGTWTGSAPINYAYQWQRCTPGCADITGATGSTYRLAPADQGNTIKVRVIASNGIDTTSAISAATATITGAPATSVFYTSGFEHRTVSSNGGGVVTGLNGTASVTIDTATKRSGVGAARFTSTGANYREWDTPLPAASPTASARLYVMLASLPSNNQTITEFSRGVTTFCEIGVTSAGVVYSRLGGSGQPTQAGPTLSTNRWYRIDYSCDSSANPWVARFSVDGAAQPNLTWAAAPDSWDTFQIGIDGNSTFDVLFDDVAASSTAADYPLGSGRVLGYTVDGTGTHASHANFGFSTNNAGAFTALSAADDNQAPGSAQYLDEWPVTTGGAADLIRQTSTTGRLSYTLADTAETSAINAVSVLAAGREASVASSSIRVGIDGGFGDTLAMNPNPPTTLSYYRSTSSTVPGSGGTPWTPSTFNATKVSLGSTDVTAAPYTDALLAEVDFAGGTPPAIVSAPTISGTPHQGNVLSATTGIWTPPLGLTYAYQWQRCNPGCVNIAGATNATYTLVAGDKGATVQVVVTATSSDASQAAASAPTTVIAGPPATLVAMDGFETGDVNPNGNQYSNVFTAGGTVTGDSTWSRNGRHSARVTNTGSSANAAIEWTVGGTIGVSRVAMRLESLPTGAGTRELMEFRNTDGINCEVGFNPASGRIYAGSGASSQAGPVITAGRWYVVDMRCNVGTATRTIDWMVDGVAQAQVTNPQAASTLARFTVGNTGGGTNAYVANYDDIAISQTTGDYPIGFGAIDPAKVHYIGTHNTITSFDTSVNGGSTWSAFAAEDNARPGTATLVNQTPVSFTMGSIGSAIRQTNTTGYLEYRLTGTDRTEAPEAVRTLSVVSSPTPAAAQNATVTAEYIGATTLTSTGDPGGTPGSLWTYSGLMTSKPGGGAWSASNFGSLQLRLGSTNVGTATGERPWTHLLMTEVSFPSIQQPVIVTAPQVQQPYGSVKVGDALDVDTGTWNSGVLSRSWQWVRCASDGTTCLPIAGAVGTAYTVQAGDVGSTLRVVEAARNIGGSQTAPSAATPLVATQPTVVASTGFEGAAVTPAVTGDINYVGTPSITTSTTHSGDAALAATQAGASDNMTWTPAGGSTTTVQRAYVRFGALPTSQTSFMDAVAQGPFRSCDIDIWPDGSTSLEWFDTAGRDTKYGPTLALNRWYLFEMRADSSGTTWRCDWAIDGVVLAPSVFAFGVSDVQDFLGVGNNGGDASQPTYVDDWMISTTLSDFPLGPGRTVGLRPDGEGVHQGAGYFGSDAGALGANPQLRLDELPAWNIADYVSQAAGGSSDFLEWTVSNPSDRSRTARAVRSVVGFHAASALGNTGTTKVVRTGDTDAAAPITFAGNMSYTALRTAAAQVAAPAGGWTPSMLDALRIRTGYSTDVSPAPLWDALTLEVEYRD